MIDRGVNPELMQAFRIGFAPSDGDLLFKHLKAKGYTGAQAIEAGVVRESTRGGEPYAFFRDRVIFPVADRRGRVVAFGGRILPEHMRPPDRGDFKPPKYINSSDTPLFHKGRMLFGEQHARQAAADNEPVIVVEGYLDVMACFSIGYKGAVAPLGTALTDEQIAALWKMIPGREKVPILCFDGDNAGRRAAARAADNILPLLQPDHSALIAFLPEGQDPDSLVKEKGRKALDEVLGLAMPLADFIWRTQTEGLSFATPESRAGLEKTLDDLTLKIADRTVQQYYKTAFRERLREAFAMRRPAQPSRGGGKWGLKKPQAPGLVMRRPDANHAALLSHQILLATLLNHPGIYESVEEEAGGMNMANKRLDLLRQAVLNLLDSDPGLDAEALQNHLKGQGFEDELAMVLSDAVYIHAAFARPAAPGVDGMEKALHGWRDTTGLLHKKAVWQELRAAGQALAQDMNEENEERLRYLHDVHKKSGE
jgi:DNA primase